MTVLILVVILILAVGGVPSFGVRHPYGWGPSGVLTVIFFVLLVMALTGRL